MKYSIADKELIVARYQSGDKIADLCAELNISKSTLYNWIKQYNSIPVKADSPPITARTVYLLERRIKNWNRSWKYGNDVAAHWIRLSMRN